MNSARHLDSQIRQMMAQRNQIDRDARIASEGRLEPRTTVELGKQVTRYVGDPAVTWAPFMPIVRNKLRFGR
jgi:hypothetical protein